MDFIVSLMERMVNAIGRFFNWVFSKPFRAIAVIMLLVISIAYAATLVVATLRARDNFGRSAEEVQESFWDGEWLKWRPTFFDDDTINDDDAGGDDDESYDDSDDDGNVDDGGDEDSDLSTCTARSHDPSDGTWKLTGPAAVELWTNDPDTPWGGKYGQDLRKVFVPEGKTVRIPSGGGKAWICKSEAKARREYRSNSHPEGDYDLID